MHIEYESDSKNIFAMGIGFKQLQVLTPSEKKEGPVQKLINLNSLFVYFNPKKESAPLLDKECYLLKPSIII